MIIHLDQLLPTGL